MKAAIFDMDGTVLDSMHMWHNMLPRFMMEWNITPDEKFYKDTDIMSLDEMAEYLITRYSLPITPKKLQKQWKAAILNCYLTEISPKPHIKEYMQLLKDKNIGIALATLTQHEICDEAMKQLGFSKFLDFILTTEDVGGVTKRRPDLFLKCASLFNASPSECVVFEDSLYPLQGAIDAGFKVCVIEDNFSLKHRDELKKISHRYITDFSELCSEMK